MPRTPSTVDPTRPLKVGVQLPEVEREVRWPEILDMARAIEDLGYDSIWLGEHLLYRFAERPPRGPWEAWTLLAGLSAVTSRVELGPLVACTNFHNPALLAKQAATIDEISGGRFVLGLGAGWNRTEFDAFGFPYDHRIDRFEEAFTIIRTLLRDGAIDFDGRFYQARDCELLPRGPRPAGPPLMIGSARPAHARHHDAARRRLERLVRRHRQRARPASHHCASSSTTPASGPAAIRGTSSGPWRVQVRMPGGTGRIQGDGKRTPPPLRGHAGRDGRGPAGLRPRGDRPRPAGRRSHHPRQHRGIRTGARGALEAR